jgi:hypothetical protein
MKKRSVVLALILVMVGLCCASFAATQYVIANDNNLYHSSLLVYTLDTSSGTLTRIAELPTGGEGWGSGLDEDYGNSQQAISQGAACIFALDGRSNDIASFSKATGYSTVGNYSNPAVTFGVGIALTPDGSFLYASYTGANNVGAWAVNSDCSLTFIAAYVTSGGNIPGPSRVTPNGSYLVISLKLGAELFAIDKSDGSMTDLGFLAFSSAGACLVGGDGACVSDGLDFTRDSKLVIFAGSFVSGNNVWPIAMSANISPAGLTGLRGWSLWNKAGIGEDFEENFVPFLSAGGYGGSGSLYFGLGNGVVTAAFEEKPEKVSVVNATTIQFPELLGAAIAVSGNVLIQSQYPNQLLTFLINGDGSLTLLSTTTLTDQVDAMFSFSLFPNTR